jgi:hypothetical protein
MRQGRSEAGYPWVTPEVLPGVQVSSLWLYLHGRRGRRKPGLGEGSVQQVLTHYSLLLGSSETPLPPTAAHDHQRTQPQKGTLRSQVWIPEFLGSLLLFQLVPHRDPNSLRTSTW